MIGGLINATDIQRAQLGGVEGRCPGILLFQRIVCADCIFHIALIVEVAPEG